MAKVGSWSPLDAKDDRYAQHGDRALVYVPGSDELQLTACFRGQHCVSLEHHQIL